MESAPFPVAAPAAKPQLFSLIVLCIQNRCHLEDTLPNSVRSMSFSLGRLQTTASVCWLWGNPPRELCFSDAGVFWIIANLTLATQSHLFQEKFHGSGIGVFWSTANSLAPADQVDTTDSSYKASPWVAPIVFEALSDFSLKRHKPRLYFLQDKALFSIIFQVPASH